MPAKRGGGGAAPKRRHVAAESSLVAVGAAGDEASAKKRKQPPGGNRGGRAGGSGSHGSNIAAEELPSTSSIGATDRAKLPPSSSKQRQQVKSELIVDDVKFGSTPSSHMGTMKAPLFDLLDVSTVKLFAEANNIAPELVSKQAWAVLTEDVNYRLRYVADLAARFLRQSKRDALTVDDFNNALKHVGQEPIRGHGSSEPMKIHYLKELKLYVRHEGVVDLAALALSDHCSTVPSFPKIQLTGHLLYPKSNTQDDVDQAEDGVDEKNNDKGKWSQLGERFVDRDLRVLFCGCLMGVIDALVTLETRIASSQRAVLQMLTRQTVDEDQLDAAVKIAMRKMSSNSSEKLVAGCEIVRALCCNRHCRLSLSRYAGGITSVLLKLMAIVDDDIWTDSLCSEMCAALVALTRNFGHMKHCDTNTVVARCLQLLRGAKTRPVQHTTALRLLNTLAFPVLFGVNVLDLLKLHYEWYKAVFDSATVFADGDRTSLSRVHYLCAWRALVHFYLMRMLGNWSDEITQRRTQSQSRSDRDKMMQGELFDCPYRSNRSAMLRVPIAPSRMRETNGNGEKEKSTTNIASLAFLVDLFEKDISSASPSTVTISTREGTLDEEEEEEEQRATVDDEYENGDRNEMHRDEEDEERLKALLELWRYADERMVLPEIPLIFDRVFTRKQQRQTTPARTTSQVDDDRVTLPPLEIRPTLRFHRDLMKELEGRPMTCPRACASSRLIAIRGVTAVNGSSDSSSGYASEPSSCGEERMLLEAICATTTNGIRPVVVVDVAPTKSIVAPTTVTTPTKRTRKRRIQDTFDVPKRFRPDFGGTRDFVFVFHQTDGRVRIKTPPPQPPARPVPEWHRFLETRGLKSRRKIVPTPVDRIEFGDGLDATSLLL